MGSEFKVCPRCGESKPLAEFGKGTSYCKPCKRDYDREYYKKNHERRSEYMKEWRKKNPEYREHRREYRRKNLEHCREKDRERYKKNPRRHRNKQLKCMYGIALDEYEDMLGKQDGVCAICGEVCSTGNNLCVDHDHDTGEVRGLLCQRCNMELGFVEKNLTRMTEYLQRYRKE